MIGALLIFAFLIFLIFVYPEIVKKKNQEAENSPRFNAQMKKLWSIAQVSMKERKPLRAEKALLTILKFDEKNAAAYNRLGILYAKESKFDEAIECFEIAQSLDNNASSLHNAGLIYLETGAYDKAAMAFEQAVELEGGVAARFIALAKALEKLGRRKESIDALESAYELEASTTTLRQILALYEASGDQEGIESTTLRINNQLASLEKQKSSPKKRRLLRAKSARPAIEKSAPLKPKKIKKPVRKTSGSATATMKPAGSVSSSPMPPRRRLIRPKKK